MQHAALCLWSRFSHAVLSAGSFIKFICVVRGCYIIVEASRKMDTATADLSLSFGCDQRICKAGGNCMVSSHTLNWLQPGILLRVIFTHVPADPARTLPNYETIASNIPDLRMTRTCDRISIIKFACGCNMPCRLLMPPLPT